jgi:hypothetical protein
MLEIVAEQRCGLGFSALAQIRDSGHLDPPRVVIPVAW